MCSQINWARTVGRQPPPGARGPQSPHRRDGKGEADLRAGVPAWRTIQSGCFWRAASPSGRTSSEARCCRKRWGQEGGKEVAGEEGREEGCEHGSAQESDEGCEVGGEAGHQSREEGSRPQGRNEAVAGQEGCRQGAGQEGRGPPR